jgi:hypothetical protein
MSKSPLSGAFAGSSEPAKKNKKNGALLLISGIALATSIGGVFAANTITINGGAEIEFGQGVASTSACDQNLTTSITQVYTDSEFRVDDVVIGGIDSSECATTTLVVSLVTSQGVVRDTFEILGNATTKTEDRSTNSNSSATLAGDVAKVTITTED